MNIVHHIVEGIHKLEYILNHFQYILYFLLINAIIVFKFTVIFLLL